MTMRRSWFQNFRERWNLKNQPLIFVVVLFIFCGYLLYSAFLEYYFMSDFFAYRTHQKKYHIISALKVARLYIEKDDLENLKAMMEVNRSTGLIDFYWLKKNGEMIFFGSYENKLQKIDHNDPRMDQLLEFENVIWASTETSGYTFSVGINNNMLGYFEASLEKRKMTILFDLLFVGFLVLWSLFYFSKDLRQLLSRLTQVGTRTFNDIETKTLESQLLVRGISAYQDGLNELGVNHDKLKSEVLSAIQHELQSGIKPPYTFGCTLVRTDVNHFSSLFHSPHRDQLMHAVGSFFESATQIIDRYGGYVYEFIGDEVIFYFKDEEHRNSSFIAMCALNDIHKLASEQQRTRNLPFRFTVKSSVAKGDLRFDRLVRGHSFAGSILIETVRMLSLIVDKEENQVYVSESVKQNLPGEVVHLKNPIETQLKGLNERSLIYPLDRIEPLSSVIDDISLEELWLVSCYRKDEDIRYTLKFLSEQGHKFKDVFFNELIRQLRLVKPSSRCQDVKDSYRKLIEYGLTRSKMRLEKENEVRLASVCSLATNLFRVEDFDAELRTLFKDMVISGISSRVVANCIEVLSHFASDEIELAEIESPTNHRAVANSLIYQGKKNLAPRLIKKLRQLLHSEDFAQRSSALYALGELAMHHRKRDGIFYKTNLPLQQLLARIPDHFSDPHESTRRQAYLAVHKIADEELSKKLELHLEKVPMRRQELEKLKLDRRLRNAA